jgi:hypothetical protein
VSTVGPRTDTGERRRPTSPHPRTNVAGGTEFDGVPPQGSANREERPQPESHAPSLRARMLVAIAIGEACGLLAWATQFTGRTDWAQIWYGARALIDGTSPYSVVGPGRLFEWEFPLLYPLPAIVVGVPFSLAPLSPAVGLFVGCSTALLAFGLTKSGWAKLVLLACAPFALATLSAQWSVLLTAAVLLPPLGFLFVAKPTVGAALWLYRPSRGAVAGGILLLIVSFVVRPSWLAEWVPTLSQTGHMVVPLMHAGGPLLLLALLRWRRPEARMLLALACVPQTALLYEAVPLMLVPASISESSVFVALTWIVFGLWAPTRSSSTVAQSVAISIEMVVPLLYLPCLIMILRRPNEGEVPCWVERGISRVRDSIRRRLPGNAFHFGEH